MESLPKHCEKSKMLVTSISSYLSHCFPSFKTKDIYYSSHISFVSQIAKYRLFQIWRIFSSPKDFAEENFKFDENGEKFSKSVEKTPRNKEKLLATSNFSFFHSVFKRLVLQTHKNKSLLGRGLMTYSVIWIHQNFIV